MRKLAMCLVPLALSASWACGDDSSAPGGSSAGGSGAGGASGGAGGAGGASGCPAGSHLEGEGCASELTGWEAGPELDHRRDHHVTFVADTAAGPFLFVAFGMAVVAPPLEIERAAIQPDGTLAAFETIGEVPAGLIGPGFAQDGRSFVIIGGLGEDGNSTTATYQGSVSDDGTLSFEPGPPLGESRYHVGAAYAQGHVFAIGGLFQDVSSGMPSQMVHSVVERASFQGGELGPWETVTPLPSALTHMAVAATGDAIYVVGGGSLQPASSEVLRATVSADGELGSWQLVGELSEGRATSAALVFLDQLYVLGGMSLLTGNERDTVLRASLDPAGALDAFSELLPLPLARAHSHHVPLYEGRLYSVGGSISHDPQPEVFIGTLE